MSVNPYESSRVPAPQAVQPLELPVRIEHEATLEDYVEFYHSYQRSSNAFNTVRIVVPAIGIVFVLLMPLVAGVQYVLRPNAPDGVENVIAALGVVVIAVPLLIALAWWGPPRFVFAQLYRFALARGDAKALFGPHVLTITAEHLMEQGPKAEHRFAISSVQKIMLAPRHIFLFLSTLQGIVIPRRALASEQDAEALAALLGRLTGAKIVQG